MRIIILRGVSGSGKTTFAANVYPEALSCSADHFFYNEKGEYEFRPELLPDAHISCFSKFLMLLSANKNEDITIVVDNTNTTVQEMSPYYMAAGVYMAEIEIVRMDCRVPIAFKRNVHEVSLNIIRNMFNRFEALPAYWPREKIINTEGEGHENSFFYQRRNHQ